MVPLVLVPQVLLAGAMIPFEEMNQFIPWFEHRTDENGRLKPGRVPLVAELCPLRYSYEMFVVAQATENLWEIERLKIQKQVDILKAKPGMLTPTERDKMHLLLSGLTAISSLEAPDADTAKYYVRTIRRLATGQSIDELTDFVKKLEKIKKQTIVSFYVNDRVQGIFEYAEAQRQSREAVDRPSIFLAKLQPLPFMGDGKLPDDPGYSADHGSIPTLWKDYMILMIMGIVPLVISGFFVKRRLEVRARHARL